MAQSLIRQIEGMEALDGVCHRLSGLVGRVTGAEKVKNALSGTWLGHPLHPVLTDVPIGAYVMASVLDVTAGPAGAGAARRLVGVGLLATVPTAASGASDWSDTYGPERRVGVVHAVCNATASTLQAASLVARRKGRRGVGAVLSGIGLGFTLSSAYLGGHLSLVRGVGVNHTAFQPTVGQWTDVAALSDLGDGKPLRVTAGGVPVVLVRRGETVHALSAVCTHAGGPLDEGEIRDGCIRCPWHGSEFRLTDGAAVRGPAAVDAPRWDTKVDDGRVQVRSA
ncbi:Rieske 2Fe-2S domain-containing protein [Streptomyces sp. B-S-A8]|uniref:Rieske 2Fe-2S domain-containing protein n=1 Tax=Streptomyces solicavernae TaxID=3043614 RepID=A0ABT6RTG2_9ACTN|nr:Rieske 2Fe-2S domain-containing protein [Streptomyces sp. B-S-A8]MDI3387721.1 Rieske 2Fe-2S domain-containing protein [Streptomyces sp. B-S-A8]